VTRTVSKQRWIVVRNWERFQHYRDRTPVWIKVYTELLDDPNYLTLTLAERGILQGLWLMTANSRGIVPRSTSYLSRKLGGKIRDQQLASLNHAGYITFSASKPLAHCYQPASATRARGEALLRSAQEVASAGTANGAAPAPEEDVPERRITLVEYQAKVKAGELPTDPLITNE